jgi:hypothetical protein
MLLNMGVSSMVLFVKEWYSPAQKIDRSISTWKNRNAGNVTAIPSC